MEGFRNNTKKPQCSIAFSNKIFIYIQSFIHEARKSYCMFFVAILSLAVCFITSMTAQAVILQAPKLFLINGTYRNGDFDLILTQKIDSQFTKSSMMTFGSLNLTAVSATLKDIDHIIPSGRIGMDMNVYKKNLTIEEFNDHQTVSEVLPIVAIDPEKESRMYIADNKIKSISEDGILVTAKLADFLNFTIGDTVWINPLINSIDLHQPLINHIKFKELGYNIYYNDTDPNTRSKYMAGNWGGTCRCPDGNEYQVGDKFDSCESLNCVNGEKVSCNKEDGNWSKNWVICNPNSNKKNSNDKLGLPIIDLTNYNQQKSSPKPDSTKLNPKNRNLKSRTLSSRKAGDPNFYYTNKRKFGWWGGYCTCPNGSVYTVADNNDKCGSLACKGGVADECIHAVSTSWKYKGVICDTSFNSHIEDKLDSKTLENQNDDYSKVNYNINVLLPYKIEGFIDDIKGLCKNDDFFEYVSFININGIGKKLAKHLNDHKPEASRFLYNDEFSKAQSKTDFREFSNQIIINYKDRKYKLLDGNFDNISSYFMPTSASIVDKLQYLTISAKMPILEQLFKTRFGNVFIQIVLYIILFGMLVLSALVIYGIILKAVISRTYDIAIKRVLGLNKFDMVVMLVINAVIVTFIGVLIGIFLTMMLFSFINNFVLDDIKIDFKLEFFYTGFMRSLFVCLVIPQIASILPIMDLLNGGIVNDLDKTRAKTSSMQVKFEGSQTHTKFNWKLFFLSIVSVIIGCSLFFAVPLSMLTLNISIIVVVFFGLLSGILIGNQMIFINFSYLFESMFLNIFRLFEKKLIQDLVRTNMISHRQRNRRTIVIISLGLAFINFIYITFLLNLNLAEAMKLVRSGGTLTIKGGIKVSELKELLHTAREILPMVDYSYHTFTIDHWTYNVDMYNTKIQNVGKLQFFEGNPIVAISPSYKRTCEDNYFKDVTSDGLSGLDAIQNLYSENGIGSVVTSEYLRDQLAVDPKFNDTFQLVFNKAEEYKRPPEIDKLQGPALFLPDYLKAHKESISNKQSNYELSISSGMDVQQGFRVSRKFINGHNSPLLISMPTFFEFVRNSDAQWKDVILDKVQFRIKNEFAHKKKEIEAVFNAANPQMGLWYLYIGEKSLGKNADLGLKIANYITDFVVTISLSISFFSLTVTMASNIIDSAKEIAILRCIGLDRRSITKVYVYESLLVVILGGFIGICNGLLVGWTIVFQSEIWQGLSPPVVFPWYIMITVIIFGIISSFFTAYIPVKKYLNTKISILLKGNYSD